MHCAVSSFKSYYNLATGYSNPDTLQKGPCTGRLTIPLIFPCYTGSENLFAELAFEYIGTFISVVYPIYGYDYFQRPQSNLAFSAEKGLQNPFHPVHQMEYLLNSPNKAEITLLVQREITKFNFSFGLRYAN